MGGGAKRAVGAIARGSRDQLSVVGESRYTGRQLLSQQAGGEIAGLLAEEETCR